MEEEFKLRVTQPRDFERIAEPPEVVSLAEGPARPIDMTADYIDTEDLRLLKAGYAYRIRWEGSGWMATVKADLGRAAKDGLHRHREWEVSVPGPEPNLTHFEEPDLRTALAEAQGDRPLVVLFRVTMARQSCLLRWPGGTRAEWAADRGRILAGERSLTVCEVEIEHKEGPLEPIRELAEALQACYPLIPDPRTKFARGLELAGLSPSTENPEKGSS